MGADFNLKIGTVTELGLNLVKLFSHKFENSVKNRGKVEKC